MMDDIDMRSEKTLFRYNFFIKRTHVFGTRLFGRPFHAPSKARNMRIDRKGRNFEIEKKNARYSFGTHSGE